MRRLHTAFTWILLLNKRILKQPMFLVLLALVPALVLGIHVISRSPGSLVTVALAPENADDPVSSGIIRELCRGSSAAVRYYACRDRDELKSEIAAGNARMGCLLPDSIQDLFDAYAAQEGSGLTGGALQMLGSIFGAKSAALTDHPIICYTATNDIVSKLTREHLYGRISRHLEAAVLKNWLLSHPEIGDLTDEEREAYALSIMDENRIDYDFFELSYLDGETITDEEIEGYIASPMRGLLAALLTLTALAAVLFLCADLRNGRFVWIDPRRRPLFCFGYILIPMADVGIAVYLALLLSGTFTSWQKELPALLLFVLCASGFANLLRILLRRIPLIASSVPILLCACLFLTPVFMDLKIAEPVQILLPPYLYLKSIHGLYPPGAMFLYAAAAFAACMLLDRGRNMK